MDEYISREEAILALLEKGQHSKRYKIGETWELNFDEIREAVNEAPAADVRPVVTCGKCKYGKYTGMEWLCDKHSGHVDRFGEDASYHEYHSKNWYCADGERRSEI